MQPVRRTVSGIPIIYDDAFLAHHTGRGHAENAGRLRAVVQALRQGDWVERLAWQLPTPIHQRDPLPWIEAVHASRYVQTLKKFAQEGGGYLDPDTVVSEASYDVALLAVNAWLDAVDFVLNNECFAFVLARPPGHHALKDQGMGFCLLANAAISAHYALQQPNIQRVAILDWDVHHGNGTQALVEANPQVIYCSLHQSPAYPGTGFASETGFYGNVLNLPMLPGSTIADYQSQFEGRVIPFIRDFAPDLLIVSAGYDANAADPLAEINLNPADYGLLAEACLPLAPAVMFGLEGGYDYATLAASVMATLEVCWQQMRVNEGE
jgi:acetoin utilization deacetylase AcuC-like enzyme